MEKVSLIRYNADKRYYVFVSTENCSRRKTGIEELKNDLAGKSLLKGVFLYVSKNHLFDLFKGLLAFISFVIVIYQRPYIRWFVVVCWLWYKGVLSVCSQSKIIR